MKSWQERSFLLALVTVTAVLQVTLAGRQSLWADEIFSLATATGHSLEHPSAIAQPGLGDFVEPNHPETAEEFRRYLKHDNPPASPTRVIRASYFRTPVPLFITLCSTAGRSFLGRATSPSGLFSVACSLLCFPLLADIARRTGGKGAIIPSAILFAFSPLGIYYSTEARMYSLLWLCVLAMTWASLVLHERGGSVGQARSG